jgi:hypothetical protein
MPLLTLLLACRNPGGEIRANLVVPTATAVITYNPSTYNPSVATTVQAQIVVTVAGLTGAVTMAHLHGPAFNGVSGGVLVVLCSSSSTPCTLSNSAPQSTFTVAIPYLLVSSGLTYFNLHTDVNQNGEVRGQVMSMVNPPAAPAVISPPSPPTGSNMSTVTFPLSSLQEAAAIGITLPFTANYASEMFSLTNGQCTVPSQINPPSIPSGSAPFSITFSANGSVTFSNIVISSLSSDLSMAHIHGPCPTSARCNAGVVYWICGLSGQGAPSGVIACPSGTNPTISGFAVNTNQSGSVNIELLALYEKMLAGSNSYYVNFHTTNFPAGELRADLIMPQGSVTVVYNSAAPTTAVTMGGNQNVLVIPASVTIFLTGMTGAPTAIHLHGPAGFAANAGVLVQICGGTPNTCVFSSGTQTFTSVNLPIALLQAGATSLSAWPYWNVHTSQNGGGETRGQLVQTVPPPPVSSGGNGAAVTFYQDAACTQMYVDYTKLNIGAASSVTTPPLYPGGPGLPNPVLAPLNACINVGYVYDQVTSCGPNGISVVSYNDSACSQPLGVRTFPLQCSLVPGTTFYSRATCSSITPTTGPAQAFTSTVPLNVLQLNNAAPSSFTYTATAAQEPPPAFVASCATASFTLTFGSGNTNTITFSNIVFSGNLSSNLIAAHIHGPCPVSNTMPCNAPPIYLICGASCPTGTNPTIPGFTVVTTQNLLNYPGYDGSVLLGLYQSMLSGNSQYYVNFHTAT